MVEVVDLDRCGIHQALDAFGYGHVVGIGVVGVDGGGIGRGHHHFPALGLGVPSFAHVGYHGKIGGACNAIKRNDTYGTALGLQSNRLDACNCCYHIAPGAGGIDENFAIENSLGRGDLPSCAAALDFFCCGTVEQFPAARLEHFEITPVQQVHVEVTGVGVKESALGITRPQYREVQDGLGFGKLLNT